MNVTPTFSNIDVGLVTRCSLDWLDVEWMAIGSPRNRNVVGDEIVLEPEIEVVGIPSGGFDGETHTLGDIGSHP